MMENIKPMDIEKRSFAIITELLGDTKLEVENELVIKRVIHTTADFDYVQNLVSVKGAANPFMFVVLLVGVQGVAEFLVSGILGGIVARAVAKYLK